jgi:hypothetical protein
MLWGLHPIPLNALCRVVIPRFTGGANEFILLISVVHTFSDLELVKLSWNSSGNSKREICDFLRGATLRFHQRLQRVTPHCRRCNLPAVWAFRETGKAHVAT